MTRLPSAEDGAVRLNRVDIAAFDPNVLGLVDRLLHDDGRRLHDNRLLNDDRRGSHDSRSWRHDHWRGSRHCACDKPAEESAADDASCNRTTATMVVVMIMVVVVQK